MDFAFHGSARDLAMVRFDDRLAEALEAAGHTRVRLTPRGGGADVVFAHIGPECGPPYQRPDPTVLVVGLLRVPRPVEDLGEFAYGCLVRSVSDLLITVTGPEDTPETWVAGLDRPLERIAAQAWSRRHFALLLERLQPLLGAHLAMDNIFDHDLDEGLLDGGSAVEELRRAAAALADQGALPEGYPVRDVVGSKDASQLERLARARSISYGDLSARQDELRFWMTTSGVDWRRR